MFYTRYTVNKYAYFHKVTCGIELMIVYALEKANQWIQFPGKKPCNIYECHKDMHAFTQLTDNVIFVIRNFQLDKERPEDEHKGKMWDDMKEAQELVSRIFHRDLYTCAYEASPSTPKALADHLKVEGSLEILESEILKRLVTGANLSKDDVIVKIINLHFGMKEENPVERLKVYSKHHLNKAYHLKKEEASRILAPVNFNEVLVRVYSTKSSKSDFGAGRTLIEKWAEKILKMEL